SPVPTGISFGRASIEGSANVAFCRVNLVNDHFHGIGSRGLCPDLVIFWAAAPDTRLLMGSDDSWFFRSSLRGVEDSFSASFQLHHCTFDNFQQPLACILLAPHRRFGQPLDRLSGRDEIPNQVKRQEQAFGWPTELWDCTGLT
ncbi:hypothetical protein M441DRAFT_133868, partial [Trichoderma asperellum CBS 433.97]